MKISLISDIHIKNKEDYGYSLLLRFLDHEKVKNSDTIVFLGDIFDFMVGNYKDYHTMYPEFFSKILYFLKLNKKIYYFEGNHDFHVSKLFQNFLKSNLITDIQFENFKIMLNPFVLYSHSKKIYLTHGEELGRNDPMYEIYKKTIRFPFLENLTTHVLPFHFVNKLGNYLSGQSRKKSQKKYDYSLIRETYRHKSQKFAIRNHTDIIVSGHCHVLDHYVKKFYNKSFTYVNCGYPKENKKFIYINEEDVGLVQI
jgi:UDP-2,3-diacylglucosamine hydrolase